jgi:CubicO group peptidase (beta-lactamase class C family)
MIRHILIAALTSSALATSAAAQALEPVEAALVGELSWANADTPGCAVAVERDGRRLATVVRGRASLEHAAPITADTIFEAGSVAKQFTAAAVMLLVQDGKLSLDDDVRSFIPELPDYGRPITVRQLLDHTSGLRDWGALHALAGWPRTTRVYTQADALDMIVRQRTLNYAPGTEWSYTNSGYNLAAMMVERLSGQTFAAFTRQRLFQPLGMGSTGWRDDFRAVLPGRATAYSRDGGGWRQEMPFEDAHGNGGLLTTVGDLLIWNQALEADRFGLGTALTGRAMLTDGSPTNYGLGLFLEQRPGRREVSHGGATAAYRAFAGRHWLSGEVASDQAPVSTAVLCNAGSADAARIARGAVDAVLGPPPPSPPATLAAAPSGPASPIGPADRAIAGRWTSDELGVDYLLEVTGEGALEVRIDRLPGSAAVWPRRSEDVWGEGGATLQAVRDAEGRVAALSLSAPRVRDLRLQRAP